MWIAVVGAVLFCLAALGVLASGLTWGGLVVLWLGSVLVAVGVRRRA